MGRGGEGVCGMWDVGAYMPGEGGGDAEHEDGGVWRWERVGMWSTIGGRSLGRGVLLAFPRCLGSGGR